MKIDEMRVVGRLIASIVREPHSEEVKAKVKREVSELTEKFPLYAQRQRDNKIEAIATS
jgi:glycine/serine hydroxymethyltransferase